mgnify:FL=1
MSTLTAKIIADFTTQLATEIEVAGTTATLQSATDDDGIALPSGRYFFTLDGANSLKEHISCDLVGTALTNIKTVSRQGTETAGVLRKHRIGASVVITDFAHIKVINDLVNGTTNLNASVPLGYDGTATINTANQLATKAYVDGVAIAGSPDSSTSVKGIGRVSVAPVSAAIPIFVGDNDGRVPTQSENDALAGTGTPSSSNKYVTEDYRVFSPVGMVSPFAGSSAPTGWLLCDGTAVSRTTYAALFAITSTTYGVGDGSTTFNLPNLSSRSVVGVGAGTKVATFASRSSNVITVTGLTNAVNNESQTGQAVTYVTTGSVITGLTSSTVYYVVRVSNTTFSLATTLANAIVGTVISLSSDGSGTQTFTQTLTTRTLGDTGGEENHTLTLDQVPVALLIQKASPATMDSNQGAPTVPTTAFNTTGSTAHNLISPFVALNYIIKT